MTDMTMRERVARAICSVAFKRMEKPEDWIDWLPEADAAIAAMAGPTEAMIEAGRVYAWDYGDENAKDGWEAMISAAQAETTL